MGFIDEQVLSYRSVGVLTVLVGATAASPIISALRRAHLDRQQAAGYRSDTAAQMVRQDRANFISPTIGPDDENDVWFRTNDQRARLERMLGQGGAMGASTRRAISNGEPLIQVHVYRNHVEVTVLG